MPDVEAITLASGALQFSTLALGEGPIDITAARFSRQCAILALPVTRSGQGRLSSCRRAPCRCRQARAGRLAYQVPVATLALSGLEDRCINTQVFAKMMLPQDFPGGLEVAQVPEAGHFLHQEQPDAVNKLLLNWLAKHKECPFGCSLFAHCRTNVNRVDQRLTGSPPSRG